MIIWTQVKNSIPQQWLKVSLSMCVIIALTEPVCLVLVGACDPPRDLVADWRVCLELPERERRELAWWLLVHHMDARNWQRVCPFTTVGQNRRKSTSQMPRTTVGQCNRKSKDKKSKRETGERIDVSVHNKLKACWQVLLALDLHARFDLPCRPELWNRYGSCKYSWLLRYGACGMHPPIFRSRSACDAR